MKEKIIIIMHWLVAVLAFSSFLWLDYKLILVGLLIYWLQILIFGACVLSIAQFKTKESTFLGFYLNKLLKIFKVRELTLKQQQILLRYITPAIIVGLAIIFQVIFKWNPLIMI